MSTHHFSYYCPPLHPWCCLWSHVTRKKSSRTSITDNFEKVNDKRKHMPFSTSWSPARVSANWGNRSHTLNLLLPLIHQSHISHKHYLPVTVSGLGRRPRCWFSNIGCKPDVSRSMGHISKTHAVFLMVLYVGCIKYEILFLPIWLKRNHSKENVHRGAAETKQRPQKHNENISAPSGF